MKALLLWICALCGAFTGCSTPIGQATQKWSIAHRPQIEQTAFSVAQVVAQDGVKAFLGGYTNNTFSLAAGLQSIEGNYVSPAQITGLVGVWSPNTSAYNQVAATIAADLANNPPSNKDQVVARIEGYVAGLQGTSVKLPPGRSPPGGPQPVPFITPKPAPST